MVGIEFDRDVIQCRPDVLAHVRTQGLTWTARAEVRENEAVPQFDRHLHQVQVAALGAEPVVRIPQHLHLAVQGVSEPVVLAEKRHGPARGLLCWVALPNQLVAPVRAYVVKSADFPVFSSHQDDGSVQNLQFTGEIASDFGQAQFVADVDPGTPEQGFPFQLETTGRNGVFVADQAGAEFRMIFVVPLIVGAAAGDDAVLRWGVDLSDHGSTTSSEWFVGKACACLWVSAALAQWRHRPGSVLPCTGSRDGRSDGETRES